MKKSNKHIKLDEIEKKTFFTVPDGYFDELPQAIQRYASRKQSSLEWLRSLPTLIKWSPALLIIFFTILFWNNNTTQLKQEDFLAEITDEEILDYLYYEEYYTYEIINNINEYDSINFDEDIPSTVTDTLPLEELDNLINYYDYDTSIQYY